MANLVSRGTLTTPSAALALALLAGLPACKGWSSRPAMLPPTASLEKAQAKAHVDHSQYRTQGGTPIAPVVISDDPAPAAQAPTQAPTAHQFGQAATLNGDPNGLTREALNMAIQGAMGSVANCFSSLTQDPMVAVSFEADPSGRPSLVRINGAPADAEHCIRNVVQGIRFPTFEGKGVQVDLPLSFHRVVHAPPANPGPQAPMQAPLNLEP